MTDAVLLAATTSLLDSLGRGVLAIVTYSIVGTLLLLLGYFVVDVVTPGRMASIFRTERNPNAAALEASGVLAVALIVVGAIFVSGGDLVQGLTQTIVFGLVGILAQTGAWLLFDRLIGIDIGRVIKEPRLCPEAVLVSVTRVSIGLITMFAVI
jgi:uncharacterized membrane protein YjfL (UPF0719 family)